MGIIVKKNNCVVLGESKIRIQPSYQCHQTHPQPVAPVISLRHRSCTQATERLGYKEHRPARQDSRPREEAGAPRKRDRTPQPRRRGEHRRRRQDSQPGRDGEHPGGDRAPQPGEGWGTPWQTGLTREWCQKRKGFPVRLRACPIRAAEK